MGNTPLEHDVDVAEVSAGGMRVIVAQPRGRQPNNAVVMFPHVGGLTGTMRTMAGIVARSGFLCLVPDLYHRLGRIVLDPESSDPDAVRIRKIAAAHVTDETAMADGATTIGLASSTAGKQVKVATLGFGRSGWFSVLAAARMPEQIGAAASVLGFGFAGMNKQKACAALGQLRCPVYFAFAEHDEIIPPEEPESVRRLFPDLPAGSGFVVHPGTRHPYIFPDRQVHDADAAARDWQTILPMFRNALGSPIALERRC